MGKTFKYNDDQYETMPHKESRKERKIRQRKKDFNEWTTHEEKHG